MPKIQAVKVVSLAMNHPVGLDSEIEFTTVKPPDNVTLLL